MALSTIAQAAAQLNANLDWDSRPAAIPLALEAVRYLRFNRPLSSALGTSKMDYEALAETEKTLSRLSTSATAGTASSPRRSFTQGRTRG